MTKWMKSAHSCDGKKLFIYPTPALFFSTIYRRASQYRLTTSSVGYIHRVQSIGAGGRRPFWHGHIAGSDEAHFWLNGYANKQNCRIWSEANPQVYVETQLHPEKLTGAVVQQDGATCHTARAAIDLLKDTFGDRLISRFGPVNWPPRFCDLTPLDYFLWGYVK
ncbi:uncharacterized protein TNCV_3347761 [Trichonephila clavipes]|nr:uncharacterized protein TNCV_3347761 [Trichonephila clavipes]